MNEPILTGEQRAEWAEMTKVWHEFVKSPDLGLDGTARTIVAVAERLDFLESSIVTLRAELAQAREEQRRGEEALRPTVVCLCGSTRFWETFQSEGLRLTLEGKIVLSIGICAPDSMVLTHPESVEGKRQKAMLDDLHKRKIDLADEVLILNVDGYIGDSTGSELAYAQAHGKRVRWLNATLASPDAPTREAGGE